jgi:hypothetical protein
MGGRKPSIFQRNSRLAKENDAIMKRILILVLAAACCAIAQEGGNAAIQPATPATAVAYAAIGGSGAVVKGAPYTATITNESVQTLADGTHITQSSSGTTARDSLGRTRQDAPMPAFGNVAAAETPHLVFLQDPVAGTSYTLNLTDKTAWKGPVPPAGVSGPGMTVSTNIVFIRSVGGAAANDPQPPSTFMQKRLTTVEEGENTTENLGSQIMEGVQVTGVRTTRTIPAGQIGNDRPISIVTEVWTSPELKTLVLSRRDDPRMGEQTSKLTNIQRGEPDPSLFTVPSDFKLTDSGAKTVFYRSNQ